MGNQDQKTGESEGSLFITGEWEHIFDNNRPSSVRFVANAKTYELVKLEILDRDQYRHPSKAEFMDVDESLRNGNEDIFDDPIGYGLICVNQIPDWACPEQKKIETQEEVVAESLMNRVKQISDSPISNNAVKPRTMGMSCTEP
ncbi:hypothetical protein ACV1C5_23130 [Aeromonas caviae]